MYHLFAIICRIHFKHSLQNFTIVLQYFKKASIIGLAVIFPNLPAALLNDQVYIIFLKKALKRTNLFSSHIFKNTICLELLSSFNLSYLMDVLKFRKWIQSLTNVKF